MSVGITGLVTVYCSWPLYRSTGTAEGGVRHADNLHWINMRSDTPVWAPSAPALKIILTLHHSASGWEVM